MKQVRQGVFETNSSSVHSLVMCIKEDYEKWQKGQIYYFDGFPSSYPDDNSPECGKFYTKEECINFLKSYKFGPVDVDDDEELREHEFYSYDSYGGEEYEWFEEEFTTPDGHTVVSFGYYGNDY